MKSVRIYIVCFGMLYALVITTSAQDLDKLQEQEPIAVVGTIGLRMQFFEAEGRPSNRDPFSWILEGNTSVSLYGVNLPFTFLFSEQQRDFRQPFNRFGVSPQYKWAQAHLGYRNLNWSEYALAGHSITGAGLELMPGKIRFGLMHGRLLRSVEIRPEGELQVQTPAFTRVGTAVKAGYGTSRNFADLIIFHASDQAASLLASGDLMPQENIVISMITHQQIGKHLVFDAEVAQSATTPDNRAGYSDSLNSLIFHVAFPIFKQRDSTRTGVAFRASSTYHRKYFSIALKLVQVDPDFESLGAYYFLKDLRNITLAPSIKLFESRLSVHGSYGIQTDNLKGQKSAETRRSIGSVQLTFAPTRKYMTTLSFSNYGLGQRSGIIQVDTLTEVSQTNRQWGLNQTLLFQNERAVHTGMIYMMYQELDDRNPFTATLGEYTSATINGSYLFQYIPWKAGLTLSYMYTDFQISNGTTTIYGPSGSISKGFLKNSLTMMINGSLMTTSQANSSTRRIIRIGLTVNYRKGKHHRIGFKYYLNRSKEDSELQNGFSEMKGDIYYAYSF